jgi:uncharacterized membrane protein
MSRGRSRRPSRYERESSGLEFDRVVFFSDAVFAIAMTLLVVGIGIPVVSDGDLGDALRDKEPEIVSFFISFFVIGNYWLGHHRFFSHLQSVSSRLMSVNLAYLAAIAFVPFPTALAGKYTEDPISIVIYAVTLSIASGLEAVMVVIANKEGLLRVTMPREMLRFSVVASVIPVVVFLGSIPIAQVSTTYALYSWILIIPLEYVTDRTLRPANADDYL